MSNLNWWRLIALGWGCLLVFVMAYPVFAALAPASNWMEVRRIHVADASLNEWPKMDVDRTIRKPFSGEWTVRLDVHTGEGFTFYCEARGQTHYKPEAVLPPDLDLEWWTLGEFVRNYHARTQIPCAILPGTYRIITEWIIRADGYPVKTVAFTSNAFEWR
jgi:hypothetical protein